MKTYNPYFRREKKRKISISGLLRWIVYIDLIVCLYVELLRSYSSIAEYVNVIPDILSFIALVLIMYSIKPRATKRFYSISSFLLLAWISLTVVITPFHASENYKRYRYIIIGFIILYICEHYMSLEFWNKIYRLLYYSLIIHFVMVLYQHFLIGTHVDFTNGIFGFTGLNNAASGAFCVVMTISGIVGYVKGVIDIRKTLILIGVPGIISALSEIKIYYVLVVLAAIIVILFSSSNHKELLRRIKIIIIGVALLAVAIYVLYTVMPQNMAAFISVNKWITYEDYSTYYNGIGVGRTNQFSYVIQNEFKGDLFTSLFGKGLGYDATYIPYEMGRFFCNFGIIGIILLFIFLLSRVVLCFESRNKYPEMMFCMVCLLTFVVVMFVWNASFNRMSILWFTIFGLVSVKKLKNTW